jgi:uncharacterized membrane protein HdeD (DUF308 family)
MSVIVIGIAFIIAGVATILAAWWARRHACSARDALLATGRNGAALIATDNHIREHTVRLLIGAVLLVLGVAVMVDVSVRRPVLVGGAVALGVLSVTQSVLAQRDQRRLWQVLEQDAQSEQAEGT